MNNRLNSTDRPVRNFGVELGGKSFAPPVQWDEAPEDEEIRDNMDKKQKTAKDRQEDAALNRALLWVAGAVILEGLLMLVNRYYINFYTDEFEVALAQWIGTAIRIGCILFLLLAIAGGVWFFRRRKSGKTTLLSGVAALSALALAIFCGILWGFYPSGVTLLFVLVPAVAVLALVYYLYQRECFLAIFLSALGVLGMWLVRKGSAGPYVRLIQVYLLVMAIVSLAALLVLYWLRKQNGVMTLQGKQVRILHKKANYPLLYLTCVVMLVAFAAALFAAPALTYYLIFGLIIWVFVLVVYYTVQLL